MCVWGKLCTSMYLNLFIKRHGLERIGWNEWNVLHIECSETILNILLFILCSFAIRFAYAFRLSSQWKAFNLLSIWHNHDCNDNQLFRLMMRFPLCNDKLLTRWHITFASHHCLRQSMQSYSIKNEMYMWNVIRYFAYSFIALQMWNVSVFLATRFHTFTCLVSILFFSFCILVSTNFSFLFLFSVMCVTWL